MLIMMACGVYDPWFKVYCIKAHLLPLYLKHVTCAQVNSIDTKMLTIAHRHKLITLTLQFELFVVMHSSLILKVFLKLHSLPLKLESSQHIRASGFSYVYKVIQKCPKVSVCRFADSLDNFLFLRWPLLWKRRSSTSLRTYSSTRRGTQLKWEPCKEIACVLPQECGLWVLRRHSLCRCSL